MLSPTGPNPAAEPSSQIDQKSIKKQIQKNSEKEAKKEQTVLPKRTLNLLISGREFNFALRLGLCFSNLVSDLFRDRFLEDLRRFLASDLKPSGEEFPTSWKF